jgi:hypothetical protein
MTDDALLVQIVPCEARAIEAAKTFDAFSMACMEGYAPWQGDQRTRPAKAAGPCGKNCRAIHISLTMVGA